MKTCQLENTHHLENVHLDVQKCCKYTLDNLKISPFQTLIRKILHNWKTRSRLRTLDESQLKDLGLTAVDVEQETNKPLWK